MHYTLSGVGYVSVTSIAHKGSVVTNLFMKLSKCPTVTVGVDVYDTHSE